MADKITVFKDGQPPHIHETRTSADASPEFFTYEFWAYSQLSIARFYGGCKYNGTSYTIDMDTGDLVKESYMEEYVKNHKPTRLKNSAYAKAKAQGKV